MSQLAEILTLIDNCLNEEEVTLRALKLIVSEGAEVIELFPGGEGGNDY